MAVILVLIIIAGSCAFFWLRKDSSPFSADVRSSVNFPLYYPRKLPKDYMIDKKSVSVANNVVFFNVTKSNSPPIIVSEQPVATRFNFDDFYSKQISVTTQLTNGEGRIIFGKILTRQVATLVSPTTWVILSADTKTPPGDISTLVESLKK